MIVLVTDFGLEGPYVGQVKAVLCRVAPGVPVIDLLHDAPAFDPRPAAYLLAACAEAFPEGAVFLCVVDPGVGSAKRRAIVLRAGARWYVGPDNGLLEIAARRAGGAQWWEIDDVPERLSASFHGRDLFAPAAARVALGQAPAGPPSEAPARMAADWPDDLAAVVYIDRFGNAITGLRAATLGEDARIGVGGRLLPRARTFSDLPPGAGFWYENANGLAEIAVNRGHAANALGLAVGTPVVPRGSGEEGVYV